ncbi:uncharacterized protein LOC144108670 [Amblyomma americanum]
MAYPSNLPPSCDLPLDATSRTRDIATTQLQLPSLWRKNPQVQFAQVEALFYVHRVTSETTGFHHHLSSLSPQMAEDVADIISGPLGNSPYRYLKQNILVHTTVSESARLQHLLTGEEPGDLRPCQQLTSMQQLQGESNVDPNSVLLR